MDTNDNDFRTINRQMLVTNILGLPGTVLLGMGLYGLFGANGDAFIPQLNNENVVYTCLALGCAIEIWQMLRFWSLRKKRMQISGAEPLS